VGRLTALSGTNVTDAESTLIAGTLPDLAPRFKRANKLTAQLAELTKATRLMKQEMTKTQRQRHKGKQR
jgi:hypothetical protein